MLARARLAGSGCDEAVMLGPTGEVVGGTMSNLFAVLHGTLVTPAISGCGIRGVMRSVVLREAPLLGIEVQERRLAREELDAASELFFTNVRGGGVAGGDAGRTPTRCGAGRGRRGAAGRASPACGIKLVTWRGAR